MNRKTILLTSTALLALQLGLTGCGDSVSASEPTDGQATAQAGTEAPAPTAPDSDRLLARVEERWNFITNADWIQTYDFLSPERKRAEKLTVYLGGKDFHEYENASKPSVVEIDEEQAIGYVELTVEWEPHHPEILVAANIPEDDPHALRQTLNMIETYVWVEGEWYFQAVARRNEFFAEHPRLLKRQDQDEGEGEDD